MYTVDSFGYNDTAFSVFQEFPQTVYREDPFYTDESTASLAEYAHRCFIVKRNTIPCGRVAALINREIRYNNYSTGLIGFYECDEDEKASLMLFQAAESWLKQQGCSFVLGPMNGSTWYKYRLTDPDPYPPFFLDNYHKPWYTAQFVSHGFKSVGKYNSSGIDKLVVSEERIRRFENIFAGKGIVIRAIEPDAFESEVKKIYSICIHSFKDNFLYTPISESAVCNEYRKAESFIDPHYVLLAEERKGKPLAFIFCVPNFFRKEKRSLVIKTVAAAPESRARGLGTFLVEKIHYNAFSSGYDEIIHALMFDDNVSNKIVGEARTPFRTYRLYGKSL